MVRTMDELGCAISHPAVPAAPPAIQERLNHLNRSSGVNQEDPTTKMDPKVPPAPSVPSMPSQIDTDVPRRPPLKTNTKIPAIAPIRARFRR
jgi:hypothetical protein